MRHKTSKTKTVRLFRGQTVTISYDEKFRRKYPNTYKLFHGKVGTIKDFLGDAGISLIVVQVFGGAGTIVAREHIYEGQER